MTSNKVIIFLSSFSIWENRSIFIYVMFVFFLEWNMLMNESINITYDNESLTPTLDLCCIVLCVVWWEIMYLHIYICRISGKIDKVDKARSNRSMQKLQRFLIMREDRTGLYIYLFWMNFSNIRTYFTRLFILLSSGGCEGTETAPLLGTWNFWGEETQNVTLWRVTVGHGDLFRWTSWLTNNKLEIPVNHQSVCL